MTPSRLTSCLLQWASMDTSRASFTTRQAVRMARVFRQALLSLGVDRPSRVRVPGLDDPILIPLSHQMPIYRAIHSRYDALLGDLATHIRRCEPLGMIDVGANVGDSILATRPRVGDTFIAFEPHPAFLAYLRQNTEALPGVTISPTACGPSDGDVVLGDASRGTAGSGSITGKGRRVLSTSLDKAVSSLWGDRKPNFIKIDTDGFDIDVITGAHRLLSQNTTWLLYECDPRLTEGGIERHVVALRRLREWGFVSAAAFNNTGEFSRRFDLGDEGAWRELLASQSAAGPIYYHDLLLAPTERELTMFLEELSGGTHAA